MKPIIIATLLLGIVAALLFGKQEKTRKEQAALAASLQDSLARYQGLHSQQEDSLWHYRLADRANRFLLAGQLDSASQLTRVLDSLQGGNRWQLRLTKAKLKRDSFSSNAIILSRSLEEAKDRLLATEQLNSAALQEIRAQMNQIEAQTKTIAELRDSARELETAYSRSSKQLAVLEEKYTKLDFKSTGGFSIRYFGETADGKAYGFGVGVVSNKGVYEGDWIDNKRHGEGIYIWANGDRYEGQFVADKKEGFGIYYFSSGERYEGEWRSDLREGEGSVYDKAGKVLLSGEWKADKLVGKKPL